MCLGREFQQKGILHPVSNNQTFSNGSQLFRLQRHTDPFVINNYKTLPSDYRVSDPLCLLHRLTASFSRLKSPCTDPVTFLTDYPALRASPSFPPFMEKLSELQSVDLSAMSDHERVATVINLYNLMVQVAFVVIRRPSNGWQKFRYFDNVKVRLNNQLFSFNDLENGVLRANRKAPYHLSRQFGSGDSRLSLRVQSPDNRIHFALNCGAKSCPVVNRYSSEGLQQELAISA